jgi:peptidoglycan L-alanyl-D-glutamate endopeptidase CwlK
MNKFKFGSKSAQKLSECHDDLQLIMNTALSRSKIDIGISEGYRSPEKQNEYFQQGKSKIDGIKRKGKHNHKPSLAVDVFAYHPDLETRRKIVYSKSHLAYFAGIVDAVAVELYNAKKVSHLIRWGGNWDSDGVIDFDQSFDDFPHFELIKP